SDGSSRWVTGEQARADVHCLRASAGAVLAGTGTVLADDPQLTIRSAAGDHATLLSVKPPLRVVVGVRDVPMSARVFDDAAPTMQIRSDDPVQVLAQLHEQEVRHAFLEGGPTLAAAFLRAGLIDEIVAYIAPALLGAGAPAVGDLGIANIENIARFQLHDVARLGDDVRLRLRPRNLENDTASMKGI
ncbi:MAG: RibD family protein, partial [Allobranchiibius sp.]